jgi:Autographiviridae endonuclease I
MAHWDDSGTAVGYGTPLRAKRKKNPYKGIKRTKTERSGLEKQIALDLKSCGVEFKGETDIDAIDYHEVRDRKYHPDFELDNGVLIEAKGWFKVGDRQKHLCIKHQRPELDIRFVFSNPNTKIAKGSKTTYAKWCEKNGFKYAQQFVPLEWMIEAKLKGVMKCQ